MNTTTTAQQLVPLPPGLILCDYCERTASYDIGEPETQEVYAVCESCLETLSGIDRRRANIAIDFIERRGGSDEPIVRE